MVVLDEQMKNLGLAEQFSSWHRGSIIDITALRPGTVIKDDVIPVLLRRVQSPTFVTINATDFWQRVQADRHFCMICVPLPDDRVNEISELLRRLFRFAEFSSRRARCGKIVLLSHTQVKYYQTPGGQVHIIGW